MLLTSTHFIETGNAPIALPNNTEHDSADFSSEATDSQKAPTFNKVSYSAANMYTSVGFFSTKTDALANANHQISHFAASRPLVEEGVIVGYVSAINAGLGPVANNAIDCTTIARENVQHLVKTIATTKNIDAEIIDFNFNNFWQNNKIPASPATYATRQQLNAEITNNHEDLFHDSTAVAIVTNIAGKISYSLSTRDNTLALVIDPETLEILDDRPVYERQKLANVDNVSNQLINADKVYAPVSLKPDAIILLLSQGIYHNLPTRTIETLHFDSIKSLNYSIKTIEIDREALTKMLKRYLNPDNAPHSANTVSQKLIQFAQNNLSKQEDNAIIEGTISAVAIPDHLVELARAWLENPYLRDKLHAQIKHHFTSEDDITIACGVLAEELSPSGISSLKDKHASSEQSQELTRTYDNLTNFLQEQLFAIFNGTKTPSATTLANTNEQTQPDESNPQIVFRKKLTNNLNKMISLKEKIQKLSTYNLSPYLGYKYFAKLEAYIADVNNSPFLEGDPQKHVEAALKLPTTEKLTTMLNNRSKVLNGIEKKLEYIQPKIDEIHSLQKNYDKILSIIYPKGLQTDESREQWATSVLQGKNDCLRKISDELYWCSNSGYNHLIRLAPAIREDFLQKSKHKLDANHIAMHIKTLQLARACVISPTQDNIDNCRQHWPSIHKFTGTKSQILYGFTAIFCTASLLASLFTSCCILNVSPSLLSAAKITQLLPLPLQHYAPMLTINTSAFFAIACLLLYQHGLPFNPVAKAFKPILNLNVVEIDFKHGQRSNNPAASAQKTAEQPAAAQITDNPPTAASNTDNPPTAAQNTANPPSAAQNTSNPPSTAQNTGNPPAPAQNAFKNSSTLKPR